MQPGQNLFDPLWVGKASIELQVIGGTHSLNVRLGADPEERSGSHALLLRQYPKRSSAIPRAVADRLAVVIAVGFLPRRIIKIVGHNAVGLRIETGHDRVV